MYKIKFITTVFVSIIICFTGSALSEGVGKLYVVGMGPAGPDLTAPRALEIVEKADVLLCSPRMPQRFAAFGRTIDPKKIAFDPFKRIFNNDLEKLKRTDPKAWAKRMENHRKEIQSFLLEKIHEGKTVAMMDGGDPCVYGPSLEYLLTDFDADLFEVIPGMGAVNAAAAALKRSLTPNGSRFVMLTSYESLFGKGPEAREDLLADLLKYKCTLVIYMSLHLMKDLVERFERYCPNDLPVAIVYFAGYPDKEAVVRGTLKTIEHEARKRSENWLGLVIIGEPAG